MDAPHEVPGPWRTAARAALIGALCGFRSLVPIAQLAKQHQRAEGAGGPWPLLQRKPVRALIRTSMLSELVMDKLPGVPSRLSPPVLAGRFVTGAIGGAAVFAAARRSLLLGALVGAAAAYAGAVVGHRLRVGRDERERPHPFRGVVEDAVVISAASRATRDLPFASA